MHARHPQNPPLPLSLPERRAMARAWLRLDPPARALIPRPRVYRSDARNDRSYINIALAMGIAPVDYAHAH